MSNCSVRWGSMGCSAPAWRPSTASAPQSLPGPCATQPVERTPSWGWRDSILSSARQVRLCNLCSTHFQESAAVGDTCWTKAGNTCIMCKDRPAQNAAEEDERKRREAQREGHILQLGGSEDEHLHYLGAET